MDHWGMYERLLHVAGKALAHLEARNESYFTRASRAEHELRQVVTPDGKYVPDGAAPAPTEPSSVVADRASLVPLDRESIQGYLDTAIASWRHQRDSSTDEGDRAQAVYYVDAFQSVRLSLLGDVLPPVPSDQAPVTADSRPEKCPRCGSPDPRRHPATQFEGEVQPCPDSWHGPPAYREGDTWVLGPGVISTTEAPQADTVLNWRGENFTVQSELQAARERLEAIFEASHERGDAELFNVVRHTEAQVRREGK